MTPSHILFQGNFSHNVSTDDAVVSGIGSVVIGDGLPINGEGPVTSGDGYIGSMPVQSDNTPRHKLFHGYSSQNENVTELIVGGDGPIVSVVCGLISIGDGPVVLLNSAVDKTPSSSVSSVRNTPKHVIFGNGTFHFW